MDPTFGNRPVGHSRHFAQCGHHTRVYQIALRDGRNLVDCTANAEPDTEMIRSNVQSHIVSTFLNIGNKILANKRADTMQEMEAEHSSELTTRIFLL
jgi:hypothetical protein